MLYLSFLASILGSASGNDQSDGTPSMSTGQEFATNETSMPASSTYTTNDILDELQESFSGLETRDDNDDRPHLRDHFDACLLFTEGNRDKAEEIRRFIAGRGDDFKVVLYDDEKYFGFFTPENLPTVISKHCVVFMIVIADNLRDDKFANYLRSTISMANANKATVRLVLFSKLDETYIPTSLKNSKLIPWYDKNYLETELPKLLKKCKQVRNDREKKQIKTPEDI